MKTTIALFFLMIFTAACKDVKVNVKSKNNGKITPADPTYQTNVGAAVLTNGTSTLKAEVKSNKQVVLTNGVHTLTAEVVR